MSLFASILEKLGLGKKSGTASAQATAPKPQATPKPQTAPSSASRPAATAATQPPAQKPAPMAEVDVEAKLEAMAAANSQPLNWRTSIVDLMKLLGMDSSLAERKSLATELGCPPELMQDSARMNVWLHREVLRQIAQNGGKVPAALYD